MASDIRVGIIGAGSNTTAKHIPLFKAIDGVEIVGVVNRSKESSINVARSFDVPKIYDKWEDAITDPETNAIVVGTWPYLHCPVTLAALESGKHVLTEARMAMNADEALQMFNASQVNPRLVTQVVPSPITLFADAAIKRLISEGYLGRLLVVESRIRGQFLDSEASLHWRQNIDYSGNNIMAMGIYYEALVRSVSRATKVIAQAKTFTKHRRSENGTLQLIKIPEHLDLVADLECGAQMHLQQSSVTSFMDDDAIYLFGSHGTLKITSDRLFGATKDANELKEIQIEKCERGEWQVEEDFVAAIRGERKITHTTFSDGLHYMQFTDAVNRSLTSGRLELI
tara:strand:+ start:2240 stop:3262 length:1023 start_codon:yes stop_codon:yes gene_type:complete